MKMKIFANLDKVKSNRGKRTGRQAYWCSVDCADLERESGMRWELVVVLEGLTGNCVLYIAL
jgi:hypothetical protein